VKIKADRLFSALHEAGLPPIPEEFSVAPWYQEISQAILKEIDGFVCTFERVTTRPTWQETVTAAAPEIARHKRTEVCFFSAWDFHLPPDQPEKWKLIEFNDNGSGFLFASLINYLFHELSGLERDARLQRPTAFPAFCEQVAKIVEAEVKAFFGKFPEGLFLILDDDVSLRTGKFRQELNLLRVLFRDSGWSAEIGTPGEISWDGQQLHWHGQDVCFVVNRSTDFLWRGENFAALRAAYRENRVYVAPNPFTYSTRSDKRLLEFLSLPEWGEELGLHESERAVLNARVPETHLLRNENMEEIVQRKDEFFFKPRRGYAGRGILKSSEVGRSRLRQLINKQQAYVAQRKVPKSSLATQVIDTPRLWTDLRVWAYRGKRYLISGRASRDPDILDLSPPGGWLPTYARS